MALNPDKGLGTRAGLLSVKMETKNFDRFVTRFIKDSGVSTEKAIRKIALDLLTRTVLKNPVATGRSRSAWSVSMKGLGGSWHDEGNDPVAIAKGKTEGSFENRLKGTNKKYVTLINGVYYILHLEYGSSGQAPAGMVRVSMREMTGKLPKEIKDEYKEVWKKNKMMLGKVTI